MASFHFQISSLFCIFILMGETKPSGAQLQTNRDYFVAAVFDQAPIPSEPVNEDITREQALALMEPFLQLYEMQVRLARQEKNADIIVFPQYGLLPIAASKKIWPMFMESIPDVTKSRWNPCNEPNRHGDAIIQVKLSCIAQKYQIYLVASLGNKMQCVKDTSRICQYNAILLFDQEGELVVRYHKNNVPGEIAFDEPLTPTYGYFDTDFGRLGLFSDFDIFDKKSSIDLITQIQIDTVVYSSSWVNHFPYLSAVSFQQGFATAAGVNFLSANLHAPHHNYAGSGIYSPYNTLAYRVGYNSTRGQLLTARVKCKHYTKSERKFVYIDAPPAFLRNSTAQKVSRDGFNVVLIKESDTNVTVCQRSLCCRLAYTKIRYTFNEVYMLGAFSGYHKSPFGSFPVNICGFFKCSGMVEEACDGQVRRASTSFEFELAGNFEGQYVLPMTVADDYDPAIGQWSYDGATIKSRDIQKGLVGSYLFEITYGIPKGPAPDALASQSSMSIHYFQIWMILLFTICLACGKNIVFYS